MRRCPTHVNILRLNVNSYYMCTAVPQCSTGDSKNFRLNTMLMDNSYSSGTELYAILRYVCQFHFHPCSSTSAEKRASGPLDEPVVIVNPAYGEVEFRQPKPQQAGSQQEENIATHLSGLPDTATNKPTPQRRKSWLQSFGKYATYSPVDSTNTPPPPRKPLTESSSDIEEPQQPDSQALHRPYRRERRSLGNIVGQASGYDVLQEGLDTPKQMQKMADAVGSLSLSPSQKEPLQDD